MYKTLSGDYDRFVNWPDRLAFEMPFLEKQLAVLQAISPAPLHILDVACGTGMHAIALAQKGHRLSAADLVPQMTKRTRQNSLAAGVDMTIKTAGFSELEKAFGSSNFDLVVCLGNSLPHVLSLESLSLALKDFYNCLRPGGMLVIQNRNFDAVMASQARWMEPQVHREGSTEWVFQRFYDFEPDGLIRFNVVTLKRSETGVWRSFVGSTFLRPQPRLELVNALAHEGFNQVTAFGSMGTHPEPFDPQNSGNLVLTATKK